jgi:hypothetical protein
MPKHDFYYDTCYRDVFAGRGIDRLTSLQQDKLQQHLLAAINSHNNCGLAPVQGRVRSDKPCQWAVSFIPIKLK